jgi:D-beta-D-heptose 7-phosphate kinase/D-beta-D-heptose 1-phosphate adenosyltransferase
VIKFPDFQTSRVIVVGDIILDRYIWGDVARISPEAPVPVVRVRRRTMNLGGAGNVAMNLMGLDCPLVLIGAIGDDDAGQQVIDLLEAADIPHFLITRLDHPTTTKTRIIGQNQQLLRLDDEITDPVGPGHTEQIKKILDQNLPLATAVILSDYGKGTLSAEMSAHVIAACRARQIPVFVDPKGVSWEHYHSAFCITPNSLELSQIAPFDDAHHSQLESQALKTIQRLNLEWLLVTRGARGMSLVRSAHPTFQIAAQTQEVFDVSGAGDTVIATTAAAYGAGISMPEAAELANLAAGIVIGKIGTQPIDGIMLQQAIQNLAQAKTNKVVNDRVALDLIAEWRSQGKQIVFTNGCFDILHVGHIKLLHAASEQGDRLIVGLNSDSSVKKLKGQSRPIVPEGERAAILSNIKGVDLVIIFKEETPENLIHRFNPDVLVKGGDYSVETVVGHDIVQKQGGRVVIVPLQEGVSTSNLIETAKQQCK